MKQADREQLKENLSAILTGRGDGIDLDTPFHWVSEEVTESTTFFEHLPALLPGGSILYAEGTQISEDVAAFYERHGARNAVAVIRDTIFPTPDFYHFTFSIEVAAQLKAFAGSRPANELFDHIKAYRGNSLLFTFHDAFSGWLRFSEHLPESSVAAFCKALGVSYRSEKTMIRDPGGLRQFLYALEHPEKVRLVGEPWWKRLWRRWTQK